jgi:stage V sporulation protein B
MRGSCGPASPEPARDATLSMTSPGRGTAHLVVAQGVVLVSGFAVSVILARGLGPTGFGVYGVVMSVLAWLERTLNAGIPAATAALLARDPDSAQGVEKTARLMLVLWSLPLCTLLWFTAPTMSDYFGFAQGTTVLRIAAFNIPAMAVYFAYEGILNGRRRFAAVSTIQILQSLTKLVGIVLLIAIGLSVSGAFVAHVLASLLPAVVALVAYPLVGASASRSTMLTMVRIALPLTAYSVALIILMNLSLWQLQAFVAAEATGAGLYVASLNLTKLLMVIPTTTSGVLFISLSWALANSRPDLVAKYILEAGRFALITLAPACVLLWIDAEPVMRLLYGADYADGGRTLGILCWAFAAVAVLDIYFRALMARGMLVLPAVVLVALLPVLLFLNWWWIPRAGAEGAAYASLTVLILGAIVATALTYHYFGYVLRWSAILRVSAASLVVGVASLNIHVAGLWVVVKLAALLLCYLVLLFVTRELRPHDLHPFALWKADKKSGT